MVDLLWNPQLAIMAESTSGGNQNGTYQILKNEWDQLPSY